MHDAVPCLPAPAWKRGLITTFILANLATVGFVNLPDGATAAAARWLAMPCQDPDQRQADLAWAGWQVRRYAHRLGLDNRWQMFGFQSRFNWWYTLRGHYSDGVRTASAELPILPADPPRGWPNWLLRFKNNKFELNVYRNRPFREAYARYLARQYATHDGLPIQSVEWQLSYQMILPPEEAMRQQRLTEPRCATQTMDLFPVADAPRVALKGNS